VQPLIQALKDRTMTVRQRAIVALGRIKDPQALPTLIEILLENKHESYDANKAILKFGKKALPELAKAFERTNNQQLMLLLIGMRYEGAFDLLLKLLKGPGFSMPQTAIRELGKLGDKRAIPYLIPYLDSDNPISQAEAVRALGKLGAAESIPALMNLLEDTDLYGSHAGTYYAVTEAFQILGGIMEEIKTAFPGKYPAMFNMAGASISLPEMMGLFGKTQSQMLNQALARLQNSVPKDVEIPGLSPDATNKMFEDMAWKFGVMFADAKDARQERIKRLMELLKSESSLARAAAALTLPWYCDERSLAALEEATRDSDMTVRKAATWAFHALQKALLYRKQTGM
jgi:HEAT repeat protein